jgi:uncharacterized protein YndB with AHSA1/START domain
MVIPPVEKMVRVHLVPAEAFELFTRQLARWWPLAQHSCGGADALDVEFEARIGGAVVERTRGGARHVWGTVTAWDPPHRFTMTWHSGVALSEATRLTVEFAAGRDGGTEVRLLHDGWQTRDKQARDKYEGGWQGVLAQFVAATRETV